MISHLSIRNFQSLKHVELDLLPLTVIVGASSSGKSAFTRAVRTLTSNRRGNDFITHGEKVATISAVTDRGTVTLKRGKGTNDNEYIVTPSAADEQQRTFTKLNGETPPEVSAFIGIPAKDPLNYAGQFDKPYLLDDVSGSEVARVFGSLTNVHVIFEGARESNRRKLSASSTLKTRVTDLTGIKEQAESFKPLKQQLAAIEEAEKNLELAKALQLRISRLQTALTTLTTAAAQLRALKPILDTSIPDPAVIIEAHQRLTGYTSTREQLTTALTAARSHQQSITEFEQHATLLEQRYMATLSEAAVCPTCHQSTSHLEHSA